MSFTDTLHETAFQEIDKLRCFPIQKAQMEGKVFTRYESKANFPDNFSKAPEIPRAISGMQHADRQTRPHYFEFIRCPLLNESVKSVCGHYPGLV